MSFSRGVHIPEKRDFREQWQERKIEAVRKNVMNLG